MKIGQINEQYFRRITDDGKTIPLTVKEGDIIIYSKYGGTELKVGGSDLLIIKENDILAVQES